MMRKGLKEIIDRRGILVRGMQVGIEPCLGGLDSMKVEDMGCQSRVVLRGIYVVSSEKRNHKIEDRTQ